MASQVSFDTIRSLLILFGLFRHCQVSFASILGFVLKKIRKTQDSCECLCVCVEREREGDREAEERESARAKEG